MDAQTFERSRTHASLLIRLRDTADHEAWTEFHERYAVMIRLWCRQWFPLETDDSVQDVLLLLIRRLKTFEYDPSRRFRGYLKTVTHQLMADLKEREQRWRAAQADGPLEEAEATQDLWDRLASEYDLELLEKAKKTVRGRVEPRTWSAYLGTAEEWRKPADVARELGMKIGAVFQAKHSVITQLRAEIQKLQGHPSDEVSS